MSNTHLAAAWGMRARDSSCVEDGPAEIGLEQWKGLELIYVSSAALAASFFHLSLHSHACRRRAHFFAAGGASEWNYFLFRLKIAPVEGEKKTSPDSPTDEKVGSFRIWFLVFRLNNKAIKLGAVAQDVPKSILECHSKFSFSFLGPFFSWCWKIKGKRPLIFTLPAWKCRY